MGGKSQACSRETLYPSTATTPQPRKKRVRGEVEGTACERPPAAPASRLRPSRPAADYKSRHAPPPPPGFRCCAVSGADRNPESGSDPALHIPKAGKAPGPAPAARPGARPAGPGPRPPPPRAPARPGPAAPRPPRPAVARRPGPAAMPTVLCYIRRLRAPLAIGVKTRLDFPEPLRDRPARRPPAGSRRRGRSWPGSAPPPPASRPPPARGQAQRGAAGLPGPVRPWARRRVSAAPGPRPPPPGGLVAEGPGDVAVPRSRVQSMRVAREGPWTPTPAFREAESG
ncbi:basic proline-rich protein-like [Macaca nemestrina]|uniref:basic proline-rich protein-like n=1 Tax=Macaca nemestrina TaxID=9545 RepID=UPI0039B94290